MNTPFNTSLLPPTRQEDDLDADATANTEPHDQDLQAAIASLTTTIEYITTLPVATSSFTAVDRALLDAINVCVGMLGARHNPLPRNGAGKMMEDGGEEVSKGEGSKKLEELVMELVGSVRLLGGEDGGGERGKEEEKVKVKEKEEGWVDVSIEEEEEGGVSVDLQGAKEGEGENGDGNGNGNLQEGNDDGERHDQEEEKVALLPPLSIKRQDDLLKNIATTTSQILALTQALHSPSTRSDPVKTYPLVTLTSELGDNSAKFYRCQKCLTHLALQEDIISRNFRGHHGKAFLFERLWNVTRGKREEKMMTTGRHVVVDVHCRKCRECVGWVYEKASEVSESYKVGRFILEMELVAVAGLGESVKVEGDETVAELQHRLLDLLMKEEKKDGQSGNLEKRREGVSEK